MQLSLAFTSLFSLSLCDGNFSHSLPNNKLTIVPPGITQRSWTSPSPPFHCWRLLIQGKLKIVWKIFCSEYISFLSQYLLIVILSTFSNNCNIMSQLNKIRNSPVANRNVCLMSKLKQLTNWRTSEFFRVALDIWRHYLTTREGAGELVADNSLLENTWR